jgi:hypothetical protein
MTVTVVEQRNGLTSEDLPEVRQRIGAVGPLSVRCLGEWGQVLGARSAGRGLCGPPTCHGRNLKHSGKCIRLGYHPSSSVSARLVKK